MKSRINFQKQFNQFFTIVLENPCELNSIHISIYVYLLAQDKLNRSIEWFRVSYRDAMTGAAISSKKCYYRHIADLQRFGFIKYQQGNSYSDSLINLTVLDDNFKLIDNDVQNTAACSCIYLMHDLSTGYYKIGHSKNPAFREQTLQSEKPTIKMVFNSPLTTKSIEREFHTHFANKRIRGEWFGLNQQDIGYITNFNYQKP